MIIKHSPEDFIVEEIPEVTFQNGPYTYFLLEKKDYNTEAAIQKIASYFRIPRKHFGYAGSKDRHAITKQYCSVKGKIKDAQIGDITVTLVGRGRKPISLGDLKGNIFTIVVRDVAGPPEHISSMVNYFGKQRFGRNNIDVGLALLKGQYKDAASYIGRKDVYGYLSNYPHDYIGAIRRVPLKILHIYVHAVQSLLWNEVVSQLVRRQGEDVVDIPFGDTMLPYAKGLPDMHVPLVTFDTEDMHKEYAEAMAEYGISKKDFVIREIPVLSPMGSQRPLIVPVNDLKAGPLEEDSDYEGRKIKLSFALAPGSYATVALRTMFREEIISP